MNSALEINRFHLGGLEMKSVSIILIISLCYTWFGCYTTKTKEVWQRNELQYVLLKGDKIFLKKTDLTEYFFNAKTYKVVNDTLKGNGQKVINSQKQSPESFEIPLNDILQVEIEYQEERTSAYYGLPMSTYIVICVIGVVVLIITKPFKK
jgi:hypothetical protein